MQQLSGLDASFLFLETARQPMHVGALCIFDPATAPDGIVRFKRIIQTMRERAHLAPYLRQRLVEMPLNFDFPFWVRDESFDPEFHIRHIALPKPGDWRQLCIQVARLHARPLDRTRPLWELYVIEGVDNVEGVPPGSFAMLSKTHHAAIDGASIADIGSALADPTPEIRVLDGAGQWRPDPVPGAVVLAAAVLRNNLRKPLHFMQVMKSALPQWSGAAFNVARGQLRTAPRVPRTRFNGTVTAQRVFEGVSLPLADIRALKDRAGGTVNDVVLAVCSGALRRYLLAKDELPDTSLVSMCPISIRDRKKSARGGNQVGTMSVPLQTDIADCEQRLGAICAATRNAKELSQAIGARTLSQLVDFMPMSLASIGARVATERGLVNYIRPIFNTVITNVPGPQFPVYSNGARQVAAWGLGLCIDGNGLFHAVTSYNGNLTISITCCREMMPDPAFYADCLRESFAELCAIGNLKKAKKSRAPRAGKTGATKKRKKTRSKTRTKTRRKSRASTSGD